MNDGIWVSKWSRSENVSILSCMLLFCCKDDRNEAKTLAAGIAEVSEGLSSNPPVLIYAFKFLFLLLIFSSALII